MHIGPLCPGAHFVANTDRVGFPKMKRSFVKPTNSPVGVLFRNTSTKWVKRAAVAVVVLVDCCGLPVFVVVELSVIDVDEDHVADSSYSRIKFFRTFFPTSTNVTLIVYSTVVMFVPTELSILGLLLVALLELSVVGLFRLGFLFW